MAATEQIPSQKTLKHTALHALHVELGAKMTPFAGYDMPVSYPQGLIKEHKHTREAAGLFDVSHMGQAMIIGPSHVAAATALEALVPGDIIDLAPGRQRYTQLLSSDGGILDDLMVTRHAALEDDGRLMLVVNAARKDSDYTHIATHLPSDVTLAAADDRALLALQGPAAADVMSRFSPDAAGCEFMSACQVRLNGADCHVSRTGYTGEDGFEISVPADRAEELARALLSAPEVMPVGLGARDTLRLEAGLCLYGHDIDETTSPIEAGLAWSIGKRRRDAGGFSGASRVQQELSEGPSRLRVGLRLEGRAPAREGCEILRVDGQRAGRVTSGSFAPSLGTPIAMGYVAADLAEPGTPVKIAIRGALHPALIAPMPFVPHRYHRKTKSGKFNG